MFDIYTIIPLFFFLGATYLFNRKKLSVSDGRLILISSLEAVFSYLIVYILFFEGYYDFFFSFFIMLIVMLTVAIILFWLEENRKELLDLQIETIKNTVIIFTLTFLPFYVFLTVFRFQPVFLQILYALVLTTILYLLHIPMQRLFSPLWSFIVDFIDNTFAAKFVALWLIVVLATASIALFDFPSERIKDAMNLSDHVDYFTYDGYETDLKNNFRAERIFRIILDDEVKPRRVNDYWMRDNTLFIYTYENELMAIDIPTQKVLYRESLGTLDEYGTVFSQQNIRYNFFTENETIYVFAKTGIFSIDRNGFSTITNDLTFFNARLFYDGETVSFLKQNGPSTYDVHTLESGTLSLSRQIDTEDAGIENPIVISERLFEQNDGFYHFDEEIRYPIEDDAITLFDHTSMTMTYISNTKYQTSAIKDIRIKAIDDDGNERVETFNKRYDLTGIMAGDHYYMTNFEEGIERIDIIDPSLRAVAIHRPIVTEPIWFTHAIERAYVSVIKEVDESLEYMQVESSSDKTYLTVLRLYETKTGLDLPFYSHYQPLIFIPIFIALLLPVTDNRQYITFIGFDHLRQKKDSSSSE